MSRVLVISDWDFSLLWKEVVERLSDRNESLKFSVLVVGRMYKSCFDECSSQSLVSVDVLQDYLEDFSDTPLDGDEITRIELEYGDPNLWGAVWADRNWVRDDYDSIRKKIVKTFQFYEKLLDDKNPDIIFTNAYASMPHYIGFKVAKRKGVPVLRPLHTRLLSHYVPSYVLTEEFKIDGIISEYSLREAEKVIESVVQKYERPSYEKIQDGRYSVDLGLAYRALRYIKRKYITKEYASDHTKQHFWDKLSEQSMLRLRRKWYSERIGLDVLPKGKMVYFPLHVQPEASTMLQAPMWIDQLFVIASISKSLPMEYQLVVKEHPQMLGHRSRDFYDKIEELPNVLLAKASVNSIDIQSRSAAVFTITGTAGFESLMQGKPAFVLGDCIYKECAGVVSLDYLPVSEWAKKIRDVLRDPKVEKKRVVEFVAALLSGSSEMYFMEPLVNKNLVMENTNVEKITEFFERELFRFEFE